MKDYRKAASPFGGTAEGAGVIVPATGLSVAEYGNRAYHLTIFSINSTPVTITRDAGTSSGYGSLPLYTFPTGLIRVFACSADVSVDVSGETHISDTGSGDFSVGNAAMSSTTQGLTNTCFLGSRALSDPFVSGVGSGTGYRDQLDTGTSITDTHNSAMVCYLNFIFDAGDVDADTSILTNGFVYLSWLWFGVYA